MTNKQAIITFIVGVGFLLVAFWAGMTVARNGRMAVAANESANSRPANTPASRTSSPNSSSAQSKDNVIAESYVVRVAAFGTEDKADKLAIDLRHKYLSAHTEEPTAGDDSLYRVDIGPYEKREEAEQVAHELAVEGRKGVMIIPRPKK